MYQNALCWIRRDIRLQDHHALSQATRHAKKVHLVFVFDKKILDPLPKKDHRLSFIYESLCEIEQDANRHKSSIHILYGDPIEEIPKLAKKLKIEALFFNRDYEPYAIDRDNKVQKALNENDMKVHHFKDSVFFEKDEVLTQSDTIYKVFTPYKNQWYKVFDQIGGHVPEYQTDLQNLAQFKNSKSIDSHNWMKTLGFIKVTPVLRGGRKNALKKLRDFKKIIHDYDQARDFPAQDGTSSLSPYIRHGCLSVREMLKTGMEKSHKGAKVWVSEIIWRDFYQMILSAFPHVAKKSFKPQYDKIKWPGGKKEFTAWCEGKTGFPIVDAAMRCINETGLMHNRLRMVTANFLCKILLVDWKKGEKYFAEKLLDFDLAANNGGWQWSSSSGCDAQPYFRIFNPYTQSEKFDKDGEFIKKWCPELKNLSGKYLHNPSLLTPMEKDQVDFPDPIVDYSRQRDKCLEVYEVVKN